VIQQTDTRAPQKNSIYCTTQRSQSDVFKVPKRSGKSSLRLSERASHFLEPRSRHVSSFPARPRSRKQSPIRPIPMCPVVLASREKTSRESRGRETHALTRSHGLRACPLVRGEEDRYTASHKRGPHLYSNRREAPNRAPQWHRLILRGVVFLTGSKISRTAQLAASQELVGKTRHAPISQIDFGIELGSHHL
jgi:hypothetical protein